MHAVQLRVGESTDAFCIGTLVTQVFLDTYAVDGICVDLALEAEAAGNLSTVRKSIAHRTSHFILAERDNHLLGFAECRETTVPPDSSLTEGIELFRLYVQRHSHRMGVGSALLGSTEHYARTRGAKIVWFTVWVGNEKAKMFYASHQYTDVGATEYTFGGQSYENRIYRKNIASAP